MIQDIINIPIMNNMIVLRLLFMKENVYFILLYEKLITTFMYNFD